MAKYECKVCGYIYNEQHAGRTFEELTECPICNEGKENFVALDADNNPIVEEKKEDVTEAVKQEASDNAEEAKAEDTFFNDEEDKKDDSADEEKKENSFFMYKEIKNDADVATVPESEFVVERRQDFWTPVSANEEKKEEPVNNNTTGWTISNAMGSVEKVIGGEADVEEETVAKTEEVKTVIEEEDDDMPAFNSRIESFYSAAEPVRNSHIIEEEEEERFTPLWNAGGGTVQRVIDPFNDKNDSVVKAENIGMVMPAEEPVVEEILGEEESVEEAPVQEAVLAEEVAEVEISAVEDIANEEETVEEEVPAEDDILTEEADVAEEAEFVPEETSEFKGFLDEDDDDDFFTEMTVDAVMDMPEDMHNHEDSGISEDAVFAAIDAIEFDDEVPEGGRVEVVSADGVEEIELQEEEEETTLVEETEAAVEEAETPVEAEVISEMEDEDEPFIFEELDDISDDAEANEEFVFEDAEEEEPAVADETDFEEAVEEEVAEAVEETIEENVEDAAEEIVEDTADDAETMEDEAEEVVEEETADETEESVAEESVEEVTEENDAVEEDEPVVKGWSFLDDVVEAGVATGVGVAGVNFVTKAMDEVVDEEVTEEDIEEVFVDFAEEKKEDAKEYDFKASLAEELFAEEKPVAEAQAMDFSMFDNVEKEEPVVYCNNLEKILIVPAQLNPMPLPEGTEVEGRTVLGIASEKPLVLDVPVFSTGEYNMVQYIPNSGLTSEDYQQADAIEIIVGHGNGIEKTINSKEDLRQVVNFLRLESDGCPIGIKMGAARIERDLEFCVFAKPDYVVLNNFDVVSLPYALHRATKYLNTVQSDMDIVIALDGAKDAEELAKIIAMGADVIALRNRPDDMIKMTEGLKKYARITGHYEIEDLNVKDLCTTDREIAEYTDIYHV